MTDLDPRISTFRWAAVDRYRKAHIWLGDATACGLDMRWTLQTWKPEADQMCPACRGYIQGWLDRHDHGHRSKPAPGIPVPTGYRTETAIAEAHAAAARQTACCPECQVEPGTPCHDDGHALRDGAVHARRYQEAEETAS